MLDLSEMCMPVVHRPIIIMMKESWLVHSSTASFDSDKVITRGAMNLLTGASVTVNGADFWTKNILLNSFGSSTSTNSSTLNLNCNSYVLDDLSVNDNNANVTLGGTYYGYSYSEDNSAGSGVKQLADYSSAILVNGKNTLLDASSNLAKLVLAGRAFVQRNDATGTKYASNVEDIAMVSRLPSKVTR